MHFSHYFGFFFTLFNASPFSPSLLSLSLYSSIFLFTNEWLNHLPDLSLTLCSLSSFHFSDDGFKLHKLLPTKMKTSLYEAMKTNIRISITGAPYFERMGRVSDERSTLLSLLFFRISFFFRCRISSLLQPKLKSKTRNLRICFLVTDTMFSLFSLVRIWVQHHPKRNQTWITKGTEKCIKECGS